MMRLNTREIAELAGGQLQGAQAEVVGMSHDSRLVTEGNLFAALPGERVDGHDWVAAAARAGAAAALVERRVDADLPQVIVADVEKAMGAVASGWRQRLDVTVIGITGSNGKTTVKEMLAAILSAESETLATAGNYNNEIGVPLTLARLDASHRFAVVEMGASRRGDIAYLAGLARPDIGLVTNAAPAHLEGFGSLEGVARTKGEMFSALGSDGVAVINADDAFAGLWHGLAAACRELTFGCREAADISGRLDGRRARIHTPDGEGEFDLPLPGMHSLYNALAAFAAGHALGLAPAVMARRLAGMDSLPGRLQVHEHPAGWRLVDDSYNANPASLQAGLQVLVALQGRPWLVLGDMAELGEDSARLHAEMGRSARDLGVRRLWALGEASRASVEAFGAGAQHFKSLEALRAALSDALEPGVNCLVKGSRSMGLERIVQSLIKEGV